MHMINARFSRSRKSGFVLVAMAISAVALIGTLGLVTDLGKAYIVKNEAQAFTDAASMAAALKLDGSATGLQAAKNAVSNSTNRHNFGTAAFPSVTTEFSIDKVNWVTNPTVDPGYRYVRVTAQAPNLSVLFTTITGSRNTISVGARSIAGAETPSTFGQGVFPFAPIAKSQQAPHFGYNFGDELTLLWPSSTESNGSSQKMNNLCQADRNPASLAAVQAGTASERGYIQETSASAIRAAIEDDKMHYTVTLGMSVNRTGGVKTTDVYQSLDDRVNQDSMPNQPNYWNYIQNHDSSPMRRIVVVPIVGDAVNAVVLGFAKVFLPPNQPHNPNKSKCAMYIGPADLPSGSGASGNNIVRLLE